MKKCLITIETIDGLISIQVDDFSDNNVTSGISSILEVPIDTIQKKASSISCGIYSLRENSKFLMDSNWFYVKFGYVIFKN